MATRNGILQYGLDIFYKWIIYSWCMRTSLQVKFCPRHWHSPLYSLHSWPCWKTVRSRYFILRRQKCWTTNFINNKPITIHEQVAQWVQWTGCGLSDLRIGDIFPLGKKLFLLQSNQPGSGAQRASYMGVFAGRSANARHWLSHSADLQEILRCLWDVVTVFVLNFFK